MSKKGAYSALIVAGLVSAFISGVRIFGQGETAAAKQRNAREADEHGRCA